MSGFGFEVTGRDGAARRGRLRTGHGDVDTPVFMPVGTQATVKSLTAAQVAATGAGLILGNTYHLYLRPGADVVREMGGLHRFAAWPGAMLTDSGGFQVFSLSGLTRVDTDGVDFRAPLREGTSDAALLERLEAVWSARDDRYSEERTAEGQQQPEERVEMYEIGG